MFFLKCFAKFVRTNKFPSVNPKNFTMSSNLNSGENLITDFCDFKFSPCKLLNLPIEENCENYVRRYIKGVIFSHVSPSPLSSPKLVSFSVDALTDILDLSPVVAENQEFVDFIAGNEVLPNSTPLAHRYGGHQFGVWAMQLGDGRAILLGEYINRKGERWELQLKGSGKTPYSRDGDGRAVLRSSIREFLCSEAMFYLGIPTTRAAAVIVSENKVVRDLLYDGHPQLEPAAVVLRLAQSWFRIGSLEILSKTGEIDLLRTLVDFIIEEHFPDLTNDDDKIVNFLLKIFQMSSDLVVKWQAVGFTHGVLNTDNMSLLGLTIDYGPFGFMEEYDPFYVPNHSDSEARYCYGRQVQIVMLNMLMLTKALAPLLPTEKVEFVARKLQAESNYTAVKFIETMSHKLGFLDVQEGLVESLIKMLEETRADFIMTLRELSETPLAMLQRPESKLWALKTLSEHNEYSSFIDNYQAKIKESGISDGDRMEKMCTLNPCYVLRNWMAQQAINKADKEDYSEVNLLLQVLKTPFTRQEEADKMGYSSEPPKWSKTLCLSCSS